MLTYPGSAQVGAFRQEFRSWLSSVSIPRISGTSLTEFIEVGRRWQQTLAEGRFVGVHWPEEHGGRGSTLVEESIVQEELVRVGAPQILGLFGLTMVGPVLIAHGTEEQRRSHLARILRGDDIWCQGFSEPGAGSDLASVRTRAEYHADPSREGGGYFSLTGQKVWTSFAQVADWCFVLARTSDPGPNGTKHEGLSYLLVRMDAPGMTVRPLRQITGDEEFNEVFFDSVEVPRANIVGEPGQGWTIAVSTLMYERVVLTAARALQSESILRDLVAEHGTNPEREVREQLANAVATSAAVRALSYEHFEQYAAGGTPGPEGSLDKLLWSESFQEITKLNLRLKCGLRGLVDEHGGRHEGGGEASHAIHQYLYSRGRTIAAGTSEIQRSIIAERVVGLPRK